MPHIMQKSKERSVTEENSSNREVYWRNWRSVVAMAAASLLVIFFSSSVLQILFSFDMSTR